jgi:hypothetical protein
VQQFVTNNPTLAKKWGKSRVAAAFGEGRATVGTGVYTFNRAVKGGDEQLSTDSYRKAQRQNYYVQVTFETSTGRKQLRVAIVKQLLWLRHPKNTPWQGCKLGEALQDSTQRQLDRDLRLAVLDVLNVPTEVDGMLRVGDRSVVQDPMRVVALSQLDGKFVVCQPADTQTAYFIWYANMSKLL